MTETVRNRAILNVEQAADYLGFSAYTVREKARNGEIPGRKVGREWRFSMRVLDDWMASGSAPKRSSFTITVDVNSDGTFTAQVDDEPSIRAESETADVAVREVASHLERSHWNPKYRRELPADPDDEF